MDADFSTFELQYQTAVIRNARFCQDASLEPWDNEPEELLPTTVAELQQLAISMGEREVWRSRATQPFVAASRHVKWICTTSPRAGDGPSPGCSTSMRSADCDRATVRGGGSVRFRILQSSRHAPLNQPSAVCVRYQWAQLMQRFRALPVRARALCRLFRVRPLARCRRLAR